MTFHDLAALITAVRNQWTCGGMENQTATALAVLHGLAERAVCYREGVLTPAHLDFFNFNFDLIKKKGDITGLIIEQSAQKFGLHVCCPEDVVRELRAFFGSVETTDGEYARIILLDAEEINIGHDGKVPLLWLPKAYREEGAGIAWIERVCDIGSVGRFEPASTMD